MCVLAEAFRGHLVLSVLIIINPHLERNSGSDVVIQLNIFRLQLFFGSD